MQGATELRDVLARAELLGHVAEHVDAGRLAMLRLVSRETRRSADTVRGARRVRLQREWWEAQRGTAAEKTAALVERLGALAATRPAIGWLQLRSGGLGGQEAALLALLTPNLTRLDLARNVIGGTGLEQLRGALQQCAGLAHLDLGFNRLMRAGGDWPARSALALAGLLGEHRGLTHVLLSTCRLTDGDGAAAAVADGLRGCTGLEQLDLSMNFREGGVRAIVGTLGGLRALSELSLRGCRIENSRELAEALVQCPSLRAVDVSGCKLGAGLLFGVWPQLPALEVLRMSHNSGMDAHVALVAAALPRCARLQRLELRHNIIGESALEALEEALPLCPALRSLDVRQCRYVAGQLLFTGEWEALLPAAEAALRAAWAQPTGGAARQQGFLQCEGDAV